MHVGRMRQHGRRMNESRSRQVSVFSGLMVSLRIAIPSGTLLLANTYCGIVLIAISAGPKPSVIADSQIEPARSARLVFPLVWKPKPTDNMDMVGC
jgi:hypothetical protein